MSVMNIGIISNTNKKVLVGILDNNDIVLPSCIVEDGRSIDEVIEEDYYIKVLTKEEIMRFENNLLGMEIVVYDIIETSIEFEKVKQQKWLYPETILTVYRNKCPKIIQSVLEELIVRNRTL